MEYQKLHENLAKKEYYLTVKSKLERGLIIKCRYTSKQSGQAKTYVLLTLNPEYDGKFHAICLNYVPVESFKKFYDKHGIVDSVNWFGIKRVNVDTILFEGTDLSVYRKDIKPYLEQPLYSSYRTFHYDFLKSIKVLDYDFK